MIKAASAASTAPARASALHGCTTTVRIGLRFRQRSSSPSSRCSATSRCCRVAGARTSSIALATICPAGPVHWPSSRTIPLSARFSRTTSRSVMTPPTASVPLIWTEAARIELPGSGRVAPTSAVSMAVRCRQRRGLRPVLRACPLRRRQRSRPLCPRAVMCARPMRSRRRRSHRMSC